MAKTPKTKPKSRHMTDEDIIQVTSIISGFRKAPTWAKVAERVRKAGLPFSVEALRRKPEIQAAFRDKVDSLQPTVVEEPEEALTEEETKGLTELVAELRAEVSELRLALETVYANAKSFNFPIERLHRPLKYIHRGRTEERD